MTPRIGRRGERGILGHIGLIFQIRLIACRNLLMIRLEAVA